LAALSKRAAQPHRNYSSPTKKCHYEMNSVFFLQLEMKNRGQQTGDLKPQKSTETHLL
jgi:hypothetical protein